MAITEISIADSITRGYYYVVGRRYVCASIRVRAQLYAFDVFVEIKGKSAMPMFRDGRSAGIL